MNGVLLDPRTGRAADQTLHYRDYLAEAAGGSIDWMATAIEEGRLPESAAAHLEQARARPRASGPTATKQGFNEVLAVDLADGAQILNTTTETITVPDYSFAVNDPHIYPGAVFRITQYFDVSTVVTTPGTLTMRLRWGGVAGTVLVASGAFAPSTVSTSNAAGWIEYILRVTTIGSAGSMYAMGRMWLNNFDPTSATTLKNELNMAALPPNGTAPASVGSLDTTTAKALSSTAQFSVTTATTQFTNHLRILECLN